MAECPAWKLGTAEFVYTYIQWYCFEKDIKGKGYKGKSKKHLITI
jgi:hypothetical protein